MGFLEDLKSGKFNNIIIALLCLLVFHLYWTKDSNKESMADNQDNAIEAAIKRIYKADVEAIRNLANIATKLQAGGLTIPGKITVDEINIKDSKTRLLKGGGDTLTIQTPHGSLHMGAMNNEWCHIYTDRPKFAFNKTLWDVSTNNYNPYVKSDGSIPINGEFKANNGGSGLILQGDGNLVLYRNSKAVWASGTR